MSKLTISIDSSKQIAQIEKLRGDKSAQDFVQKIIVTGLNAIAHMQEKSLRFGATKPEFKKLSAKTVTDALQSKDLANPIVLEIKRLVTGYARELKRHAAANGNQLPKSLNIKLASPIEKVALKITASAIKAPARGSNTKR